MKKVLLVLVLLSLVVFSSSGVAQIVEKSSDLSAYGGMLMFDGGANELMFGARYNYNMSLNNSIEGTIGLIFGDNFKYYLYHVNYRYNVTLANEMIVPFVTGGVGAATFSPDHVDGSTDFSFNFGGGLLYFAKPNLAVRVDVRDIIIKGDATTNNIELTGGISYFFI